MRIPNFAELVAGPSGESSSYAQRMHPDPRFYKYRWWVFWRDSVCDGRAFLHDQYSMSTAEAMALIEELSQRNESHWLYNKIQPRDEPGVTPFNRLSPKWQSIDFAVALDADTDSLWQGYR
jgi:hypothetical protein